MTDGSRAEARPGSVSCRQDAKTSYFIFLSPTITRIFTLTDTGITSKNDTHIQILFAEPTNCIYSFLAATIRHKNIARWRRHFELIIR